MIASHGTPAQRDRFLPPIMAGKLFFSIGMSEPEAGSDLASVKTRAVKVDGGWSITGTKVWTTLAHRNDWFIVLCRTSAAETKHEGLSQLLVDLRSPGVEVRVIPTLDGEQEFCEVSLTDVFVPDDLLLGREGEGWAQVTGELAYERGGPDRYLSAWGLFEWLVDAAPDGSAETVGRLAARYRIVRELALSAARALQLGEQPATEAAVTKDLGTILEQDTVEAVRLWREAEVCIGTDDKVEALLASAVLTAPTFTLRGGTTEILRSMVARSAGRPVPRDLLGKTLDDIFTGRTERDGALDTAVWADLVAAGLPWVGISEEAGGSGGSLRDAAQILTATGGAAAAVPLAETWLGASLLASVEQKFGGGPLTIVTGSAGASFASTAELVLAIEGDRLIARVPAPTRWDRALSGEERSSGTGETALDVPAPYTADDLRDRMAAVRVLQMAGALRSVLRLTAEYTSTRIQFGQPLVRFQAVGQQVAQLVEHVARIEAAAELASRWLDGDADADDLAVATLTAREAATSGARLAHQVHGAIGIAAEYDLQLFTRRLWSWRDEAGSERFWALQLGASALRVGGTDLWAWTSRTSYYAD